MPKEELATWVVLKVKLPVPHITKRVNPLLTAMSVFPSALKSPTRTSTSTGCVPTAIVPRNDIGNSVIVEIAPIDYVCPEAGAGKGNHETVLSKGETRGDEKQRQESDF